MKVKLTDVERVVEHTGIACGPCSAVKIYELKSGGCLLTDGEYWSKTDRTADQVLEDFSGTVEENQVAMETSYVSVNEEVVFE